MKTLTLAALAVLVLAGSVVADPPAAIDGRGILAVVLAAVVVLKVQRGRA
jgi:hypothetical protein